MAEVILRLRVLDHSGVRVGGAPLNDAWWQRALDTALVPGVGDDVQLWGEHDGALAPVKRRWWRPDGRVCVEVVQMSVDSATRADPLGEDGRPMWLPWSSNRGIRPSCCAGRDGSCCRMPEVEVRFVEGSRFKPGPGDTILLRVPADMDGDEAMRAAQQVSGQFPGHPIIVLAAGVEMEAVTLHDAVGRFAVSRDALRAAFAHADRSGVGRNEIARIAAPAYSRATVLKMLTEDNGPAPTGPAEGQLADVDGVRRRHVGGEWTEA